MQTGVTLLRPSLLSGRHLPGFAAGLIACPEAGRIEADAFTSTPMSTSYQCLAIARHPLARDASGAIFVAMIPLLFVMRKPAPRQGATPVAAVE